VSPSIARLRRDALAIFHASLAAVNAETCVRAHLSLKGRRLEAGDFSASLSNYDRIYLAAAGKASVPMAAAIEEILGTRLTGGVVVTKHGHADRRLMRCEVLETGHPVPDAASVHAGDRIEELARSLNARDLLLVALSGGASALICAPANSVTLEAKQKTTSLLLRAGANIHELNTVRKQLSRLKGGKLAELAYPATVVSLILSDVVGDDLSVIASGVTTRNASGRAEAQAVLERLGVASKVPAVVKRRLLSIEDRAAPSFAHVHNLIVGSNRLALQAAAAKAKVLGYRPLILSATLQGEARQVAQVHAEIVREVRASGHPVRPPACVLSGGETTVTMTGNGKGGRNQEFALAIAIAIEGVPSVLALCAGTDGTDGPTDAAGAIAGGNTVARAAAMGLDARDHLERNDAYHFFAPLRDLVMTGPTGTNVMDVNVLLAG
jgi:hydroxypyruvate reductase